MLRTRTIPISDILFELTKSADLEGFVFQPERKKIIPSKQNDLEVFAFQTKRIKTSALFVNNLL